jgi:GT2 family glycosyltransferase
VFERVGWVDESFDVCEDVDFNYRVEKAGFKTYMSPSIAIKYYPREKLAALWRQMVRYGKGRYQFLKKHPETFSVTGLAPVVLVAGLALLPVLGMVHSTFFKLFGLLYGLYLLVVGFSSLAVAAQAGFKYLRWLPAIYMVIHFGLGVGFWAGGARRLGG